MSRFLLMWVCWLCSLNPNSTQWHNLPVILTTWHYSAVCSTVWYLTMQCSVLYITAKYCHKYCPVAYDPVHCSGTTLPPSLQHDSTSPCVVQYGTLQCSAVYRTLQQGASCICTTWNLFSTCTVLYIYSIELYCTVQHLTQWHPFPLSWQVDSTICQPGRLVYSQNS